MLQRLPNRAACAATAAQQSRLKQLTTLLHTTCDLCLHKRSRICIYARHCFRTIPVFGTLCCWMRPRSQSSAPHCSRATPILEASAARQGPNQQVLAAEIAQTVALTLLSGATADANMTCCLAWRIWQRMLRESAVENFLPFL